MPDTLPYERPADLREAVERGEVPLGALLLGPQDALWRVGRDPNGGRVVLETFGTSVRYVLDTPTVRWPLTRVWVNLDPAVVDATGPETGWLLVTELWVVAGRLRDNPLVGVIRHALDRLDGDDRETLEHLLAVTLTESGFGLVRLPTGSPRAGLVTGVSDDSDEIEVAAVGPTVLTAEQVAAGDGPWEDATWD